jgi:hypothetical protein
MSTEIVKTKKRFIPNIPRELIYGPQDTAVAVIDDRPISATSVVKSTTKLPAVQEPFIEVGSLRELIDDRSPGGKIVVLPQFTSCLLSESFKS